MKKRILSLSLLGIMALPIAANASTMKDYGLKCSKLYWAYAYTQASSSNWADVTLKGYSRTTGKSVKLDHDYSSSGWAQTDTCGGLDYLNFSGIHKTEGVSATSKP